MVVPRFDPIHLPGCHELCLVEIWAFRHAGRHPKQVLASIISYARIHPVGVSLLTGLDSDARGTRLREFIPRAADLARQRVASHFGSSHHLSVLRSALNLGRQARAILQVDNTAHNPLLKALQTFL